ncbi:hypothetical protein F4780DRAFT_552000 [Xylariomycetidae sp. FL0641]|nr:hypothetical protein F4780DRAFT_552000 [Xylariomycetidae sp. FL0641]
MPPVPTSLSLTSMPFSSPTRTFELSTSSMSTTISMPTTSSSAAHASSGTSTGVIIGVTVGVVGVVVVGLVLVVIWFKKGQFTPSMLTVAYWRGNVVRGQPYNDHNDDPEIALESLDGRVSHSTLEPIEEVPSWYGDNDSASQPSITISEFLAANPPGPGPILPPRPHTRQASGVLAAHARPLPEPPAKPAPPPRSASAPPRSYPEGTKLHGIAEHTTPSKKSKGSLPKDFTLPSLAPSPLRICKLKQDGVSTVDVGKLPLPRLTSLTT